MKPDSITYFAYGANLDRHGMQLRCPGCRPLSRAVLPDHRLVFRGAADIEACTGESVHGALYRVTPDGLAALDRFESYPRFYTRKTVSVLPESREPVAAVVYQMAKRKGQGPPWDGYLDIIIGGCRDWGIPEAYIRTVIKAAAASYFGGQ